MKRLLLLAVSSATLAACATLPPAPPPAPAPSNTFRADDFAWSTAAGSNVLLGKVVYKLDGKAWTCAGAIGLTPDTPYSAGRMGRLYGSTEHAVRTVGEVRSRQVAEAGADYSRYVKSTRCEASGSFSFQGLPDGAWFVIAPVKPVSGQAEGRVIMQRVETRGGKTRSITLS